MGEGERQSEREAKLALVSDEAVWPYLVIDDASTIDVLRQAGCVRRALAEGRQAVRSIRRTYPHQSAKAILPRLGVRIIESNEDPKIAWRYRRSIYQKHPPEITLYRQAVRDMACLAAEAGLAAAFPEADLDELVLAHELYHHLAITTLGQVSDRYRAPWIRLGPLRVHRRVQALDEVAAHAFAQLFVGSSLSPAILDWLTIYHEPDRFDAFARRVERLVEVHELRQR